MPLSFAYLAFSAVLRLPLDQATRLSRKRRTTRPATASTASLQQRPVPAAKRLRAHHKARPPQARKQPAHGSKQRSIDG
jgi:hypothetical protein